MSVGGSTTAAYRDCAPHSTVLPAASASSAHLKRASKQEEYNQTKQHTVPGHDRHTTPVFPTGPGPYLFCQLLQT